MLLIACLAVPDAWRADECSAEGWTRWGWQSLMGGPRRCAPIPLALGMGIVAVCTVWAGTVLAACRRSWIASAQGFLQQLFHLTRYRPAAAVHRFHVRTRAEDYNPAYYRYLWMRNHFNHELVAWDGQLNDSVWTRMRTRLVHCRWLRLAAAALLHVRRRVRGRVVVH